MNDFEKDSSAIVVGLALRMALQRPATAGYSRKDFAMLLVCARSDRALVIANGMWR